MIAGRLAGDADTGRKVAGCRRTAGFQLEQQLIGGRLHHRPRLTTIRLQNSRSASTPPVHPFCKPWSCQMSAAAPASGSWSDVVGDGRLPRFTLICLGVWLNAADSLITATIMPSVGRSL